MPRLPLRWAAGDRARWRGRLVVVHYVAEDGALIEYEKTTTRSLGPSWVEHTSSIAFAIVALSDLSLNLPD